MKRATERDPALEFPSILRQIDRLLRAGDGVAARALLESQGRRRMSRGEIPPFAALARRAGIPLLGLGRLKRLVYSAGHLRSDSRPLEIAEYAGCLVAIGSLDEADGLLASLDSREVPQADLFRAFAAIKRWEYGKAIPLLRGYWKSPGLSSYQRLVAQANLAEAMIYEGAHHDAVPILRGLVNESSVRKNSFLLGKVLELSAQSYVEQAKFSQAETLLQRALRETAQMRTLHQLFIRKWLAILELRRSGAGEATLRSLAAVRDEARRAGHGNTLRDCDRFQAIATRDRQLFLKVYFGTPYAGFRDRLCAAFGGDNAIPPFFDWSGDSGSGEGPLLDLVENGHLPARTDFEPGSAVRQLLTVLGGNFYDPFSTAGLHARLYPGAIYNPDTSPARIYNAIKRVRRWLDVNRVPIAIDEQSGAYGLRFAGAARLRVSLGPPPSPVVAAVRRLRERLGDKDFMAQQAAVALGISPRTAQRLLLQALEKRLVERIGGGRSSRYRFAPSP
jgi:hypothetical protein